MNPYITVEDVRDFIPSNITDSMIQTMIEDAMADAGRVAPCIIGLDPAAHPHVTPQVRSILRAALIRWGEAGSGALQARQQAIGPWQQSETVDTRQTRKGMFWPSEIRALEDICKGLQGGPSSRAFSVAQVGPYGPTGVDAAYSFSHDTDEYGIPNEVTTW